MLRLCYRVDKSPPATYATPKMAIKISRDPSNASSMHRERYRESSTSVMLLLKFVSLHSASRSLVLRQKKIKKIREKYPALYRSLFFVHPVPPSLLRKFLRKFSQNRTTRNRTIFLECGEYRGGVWNSEKKNGSFSPPPAGKHSQQYNVVWSLCRAVEMHGHQL